jgi:hypothetical protein
MAVNTIPVGSGIAAQLVAKDEVTYGVAPSLASGIDSFEFTSETMELKKTSVQSDGLAAGHVYERAKRRVLTNYDVGGAVNMDLPTRQLAFWLRYMVGDFTESITQMGVTGFYTSTYQPKSNQFGHSFSMQIGKPATDATVEPFTYVGCKVVSWEISCSVGAVAKFILNLDGRNELAGAFPNGGASASGDPLNAATPALATWALPSTGRGAEVFHFRQATVKSGGTPTGTAPTSLVGATSLGFVRDFTLQHAIAMDTNRVFLNSSGFKSEPIENGWRGISGSMTVDFQSTEALYNAYAADTTTSLELTFTGPIAGSSGANTQLLDIIIPNIKLEGESPKVGGPDILKQQVNFTGLDDETTTPIQFTYQSEDSTI